MVNKKSLKFMKYHGCGNDFVILDEIALGKKGIHIVDDDCRGKLSEYLCERNYSIGATSMLYLSEPINTHHKADVRMQIFEADRTESNMCGNGIRCIADYYMKNYMPPGSKEVMVETKAGPKKIVREANSSQESYVVGMGPIKRTEEEINAGLRGNEQLIHFSKVGIEGLLEDVPFKDIDPRLERLGKFSLYSTGEPHMVIFVENDVYSKKNTNLLKRVGEAFNSKNSVYRKTKSKGGLELTPNGCNVNLVQRVDDGKINDGEIYIRTYERGVDDETLACGTGATASAARAYTSGIVKNPIIRVNVRGSNRFKNGEIIPYARDEGIRIAVSDNRNGVYEMTMAGPAEQIGIVELFPGPIDRIKRYFNGI